jgi:hypothetical protein
MSEGKKHDQGKAPLHMIPEEAIEGMALAFAYGAKKYDRFNYRNGIHFTRLTDSLGRHSLAFLKGEDVDPESGLPHTYHILANAAMIEYMRVHKPEFDDRYKSLQIKKRSHKYTEEELHSLKEIEQENILEVAEKVMEKHSNTFIKLKEFEDQELANEEIMHRCYAPAHKYEIETLVTIGSAVEVYEIAARFYNEEFKPVYMLRTKDNRLIEEKEEYVVIYKGTL